MARPISLLRQAVPNYANPTEKAILARDKATDKKKANATLARTLADILLVKADTAVDIAFFGMHLWAENRNYPGLVFNSKASVVYTEMFFCKILE